MAIISLGEQYNRPEMGNPIGCGFGVIDDFLSKHVGVGKVVGFFEAFVSEPEDVEAGLVAVDEVFVIVAGVEKIRVPFFSSPFSLQYECLAPFLEL
jgi:hypothetical protein